MKDFDAVHAWATRRAPVPPASMSSQEVAALSGPERDERDRRTRRWLNSLTFVTEEWTAIHEGLDTCLANAERSVGLPSGFMLIGPPTVGKTDVVNDWLKRQYLSSLSDAQRTCRTAPRRGSEDGYDDAYVPVVMIDLLASTDRYSFTRQNRAFLKAPVIANSTEANLDLTRRWHAHGTKILRVDDANLLRLKDATGQATRDSIKSSMTVLGHDDAIVVLVGKTPEAHELLADLQTFGRVDAYEMEPYLTDTAEQREAWVRLLSSMFTQLGPLFPEMDTHGVALDCAPRLWRRTQGYLGDLAKCVKGASHAGAMAGSRSLAWEHFARVTLSGRAHREEARLAAKLERQSRARVSA